MRMYTRNAAGRGRKALKALKSGSLGKGKINHLGPELTALLFRLILLLKA
ncbi:hypothetical protein HPP92_017584 [Vanilla planifolia]|uniref:Uncharacterized protein n=1 Tax=Vanilla planifolia TaxID=51239 RepID=A0A835QEB2_VANPL|nr:hypothetical protein HPP92_017584 [Vanilla planifolia]